jgi:hypothetical protein
VRLFFTPPLALAIVVFSAAVGRSQGYSPTDAPGQMVVPDGIAVNLFAAEPDIRQPIVVTCEDRSDTHRGARPESFPFTCASSSKLHSQLSAAACKCFSPAMPMAGHGGIAWARVFPGRHNHCRFALASRPVGGKQQSLWPFPIFRCRAPHERSVYGQGLKEIRLHGRLGVRSFQRARRQTCRKGVAPNVLSLPPGYQSSRPRLHPLRALTRRDRVLLVAMEFLP